jgi:hypothetical protein
MKSAVDRHLSGQADWPDMRRIGTVPSLLVR